MSAPKALILRAPGINCERETHHAFERAGAVSEYVHIRKLLEQPDLLDRFQILSVPGGFSYGDDISSGRVLAQEMKAQLGDRVLQFVDRGGLAFGICNGFQVLTEVGLLPGALLRNAGLKYVCKPVELDIVNGQTRFTAGYGEQREAVMTVGNGEGNYFADEETLDRLEGEGQVVFRYKQNPNGSARDIAG
ncbi:MAG: phosphoribosylformylglycinamidine synthase subunit PurQ, partial [Planctomycetes bacterium]|nr:phosphoribosylformylglycinamidine synthase subunit PurQ [Planctomycetota bacterium]